MRAAILRASRGASGQQGRKRVHSGHEVHASRVNAAFGRDGCRKDDKLQTTIPNSAVVRIDRAETVPVVPGRLSDAD